MFHEFDLECLVARRSGLAPRPAVKRRLKEKKQAQLLAGRPADTADTAAGKKAPTKRAGRRVQKQRAKAAAAEAAAESAAASAAAASPEVYLTL